MSRVFHRDVGSERGPRALCSGETVGVICTEGWLSVTCPACFSVRHEKAPLSTDELRTERRAIGPGQSRSLSKDEVVAGWNRIR